MSLGSARSGKEFDYDALSLVRDNDPAEVGDLWQQAALRLTEDEESAGAGGGRRQRSTSASRRSAKMLALTRRDSQNGRKKSTASTTSTISRSQSQNQGQVQGKRSSYKRGKTAGPPPPMERQMRGAGMTKGDLTRMASQAAKMMVAVDAMASGTEQNLFAGCRKWIVVVYTEAIMGLNSGYRFYIRLHGFRRSSKLVQLDKSETNKFKFQANQADVFTLMIQDVGDVEKVTVGFKGIRPGITWRAGLVRLIDAGDDDSKVLEFPIDRDLTGDECFITMPRDDLVFDEAKLASRLQAQQELELMQGGFCEQPLFWYQFGGCQMHVPEGGVCTVSQRSSGDVPTGIMQDITNVVRWDGVYTVSCRARLVSGQRGGSQSSGVVRIVLLSKQEDKEKFEMDIIAQEIVHCNASMSTTVKGDLDISEVLVGDTSDHFQKAFLCFVTEGPPSLTLDIETPSLKAKATGGDQQAASVPNKLKNSRFESTSQVSELWRCSGIGRVESRLLSLPSPSPFSAGAKGGTAGGRGGGGGGSERKSRAVVLTERPFQASSVTLNIRHLVNAGRYYQLSCEVVLYNGGGEQVSDEYPNEEDSTAKPIGDESAKKSAVFACLVLSPNVQDEKWAGKDRKRGGGSEGEEGEDGAQEDRVDNIAFLQNVGSQKPVSLLGEFHIPADDELPSMVTLQFHCVDNETRLAVIGAKLRLLKPTNRRI